MTFNNKDLSFDLEEILKLKPPVNVFKGHAHNLSKPFALDIKYKTYWYSDQNKRDADFETLKTIAPNFNFLTL